MEESTATGKVNSGQDKAMTKRKKKNNSTSMVGNILDTGEIRCVKYCVLSAQVHSISGVPNPAPADRLSCTVHLQP